MRHAEGTEAARIVGGIAVVVTTAARRRSPLRRTSRQRCRSAQCPRRRAIARLHQLPDHRAGAPRLATRSGSCHGIAVTDPDLNPSIAQARSAMVAHDTTNVGHRRPVRERDRRDDHGRRRAVVVPGQPVLADLRRARPAAARSNASYGSVAVLPYAIELLCRSRPISRRPTSGHDAAVTGNENAAAAMAARRSCRRVAASGARAIAAPSMPAKTPAIPARIIEVRARVVSRSTSRRARTGSATAIVGTMNGSDHLVSVSTLDTGDDTSGAFFFVDPAWLHRDRQQRVHVRYAGRARLRHGGRHVHTDRRSIQHTGDPRRRRRQLRAGDTAIDRQVQVSGRASQDDGRADDRRRHGPHA